MPQLSKREREEKPYYLLPDGDEADEGYTVLRDALAKTKRVAIGQLIMHGREHLVGITAHKKGLVLVILRYQDELRKPDSYFDSIDTKVDDSAVKLAVDLVEQESGKFEPEKMPNEYARATRCASERASLYQRRKLDPRRQKSRTINRCRRKRQGPNFSDTRGMGPNKDRRDSHGSIRQAHLPDAESEGGAAPTTEWDTHCKRDWPAPCLNQRKRGLSKQPQARRRE